MLRTLEIAWLGIAIITFGVAIFQFFSEGATAALFMLFITFIASMMYMLRKRQRIRFENREQQRNAPQYH